MAPIYPPARAALTVRVRRAAGERARSPRLLALLTSDTHESDSYK